ncbi:MAG: 4Fe-4S dicluster domain-containing protein [Planctomycetota bacterium]
MTKQNRREFLGKTAGTVAGAAAAGALSSDAEAHAAAPKDDPASYFQPKSYWEDRMTAPDDGKKYGWFIDTRRCFGCHGCEVACKAENDVPLGNFIRQTFYKDVGEYPKVARMFLPMACQHCEDAPCVKACPCGALHKGSGGSVVIDYDVCCGHATCVEVCPYGAIYIDPVANQAVKCHNCYHRVDEGMDPACATTCPSDAIYFGDLNDPDSKVSRAMSDAEERDLELVQLRGEKETRPRMWFAGPAPAEIEERIPHEGESYNPDAYNIYNWKEKS